MLLLPLPGEVMKYNKDTLTNPTSVYFNTDKDSNMNTNINTKNTNNKNNNHHYQQQKQTNNKNTNTNKVMPENVHISHANISIKVAEDIQDSRQQVIALLSNKGNVHNYTNTHN
jgi:hypothetical protein